MNLPILMYHKVGAPVASKADTFLNVSTRSFVRQIRLLKRLGYTGFTFGDGIDCLRSKCRESVRPLCITFDDGYRNVLENAAPILADIGWPATVFVPTAHVGDENAWDRDTGAPLVPIMNWDELARLRESGWEMAGHTRSHPGLDTLDDRAASEEILGGSREIEARLGCKVRTFCYPFGKMNARTPGLVRDAGFEAACTTASGLVRQDSDLFTLPRVKISYRDDVLGLFYRIVVRPRL